MSTAVPTAPAKKAIFPSLLTWKDPVATGKIFGGVVLALVVLKSVNLLSLFFRLATYALISSAAAEYIGKLVTGTGFVTRFRPAYTQASGAVLSKGLESFANSVPALEESAQKLVYSANVENTLKAGALSYVLYKITSWFSLYTLIFTATVAAFSLPFVYETYQTEINAAVSEYSKVASVKAGEYSKLAQEKAAPYIKQADEKLGPVSKFIKQKYQVRTASTTVNESTPLSAFEKPSAKTSGANVSSVADSIPIKSTAPVTKASSEFANPISTELPSVPQTKPLIDEIKEEAAKAANDNVDVADLKNDILKNKAAAANF